MKLTNDNRRVFRTPLGGQSSMEVAPQSDPKRGMDLIFKRSTHGEILVRLSWEQADALGRDIAALISARAALSLEQGEKP